MYSGNLAQEASPCENSQFWAESRLLFFMTIPKICYNAACHFLSGIQSSPSEWHSCGGCGELLAVAVRQPVPSATAGMPAGHGGNGRQSPCRKMAPLALGFASVSHAGFLLCCIGDREKYSDSFYVVECN